MTGTPASWFVILVAVAVMLPSPPAAAEQAETDTLRRQIETLSRSHDFRLEGAEFIGGEARRAGHGDLEARLTKLLVEHSFVLVRDDRGSIDKLLILGKATMTAMVDRAADVSDNAVPIARRGDEHYVQATITGRHGDTRSLQFLIDTGASTVVLPSSMIDELGFADTQLRDVKVQTASGIVASRMGMLARVTVGGAEAENVAVAFIDDKLLGGKRLLGMSFLGRFVMTIGDGANLLRLEPRPD